LSDCALAANVVERQMRSVRRKVLIAIVIVFVMGQR
jgi:hypothetical protein